MVQALAEQPAAVGRASTRRRRARSATRSQTGAQPPIEQRLRAIVRRDMQRFWSPMIHRPERLRADPAVQGHGRRAPTSKGCAGPQAPLLVPRSAGRPGVDGGMVTRVPRQRVHRVRGPEAPFFGRCGDGDRGHISSIELVHFARVVVPAAHRCYSKDPRRLAQVRLSRGGHDLLTAAGRVCDGSAAPCPHMGLPRSDRRAVGPMRRRAPRRAPASRGARPSPPDSGFEAGCDSPGDRRLQYAPVAAQPPGLQPTQAGGPSLDSKEEIGVLIIVLGPRPCPGCRIEVATDRHADVVIRTPSDRRGHQ